MRMRTQSTTATSDAANATPLVPNTMILLITDMAHERCLYICMHIMQSVFILRVSLHTLVAVKGIKLTVSQILTLIYR